MIYRKAFLRIEKDEKSSIAIVLIDGWGIGSFYTEAKTEENFNSDCEKFLSSDSYYKMKERFYS